MENEINSKLDSILRELRSLSKLLGHTNATKGKKVYPSSKITTGTDLLTSVEALKILKFWMPEYKTRPKSRLLLPYVREGRLSRIKIKGNRYLYKKEQVEELFIRLVS